MEKIYWSSHGVTEQQQTVSNTSSPLIHDKQQQKTKQQKHKTIKMTQVSMLLQ